MTSINIVISNRIPPLHNRKERKERREGDTAYVEQCHKPTPHS